MEVLDVHKLPLDMLIDTLKLFQTEQKVLSGSSSSRCREFSLNFLKI